MLINRNKKVKKCYGKIGCGKLKPLASFNFANKTMGRLKDQCRECCSRNNKEKTIRKREEFNKAHGIAKDSDLCRNCNKIKLIMDLKASSSRTIGYDRICKACSREYNRQYRSRPEVKKLSRERARIRRARESSVNEHFTTFDESMVIKTFKNKCFNCNSVNNLAIDHIYPLSGGNPLTIKNACVLCLSCNSSKGNKNPEEFYAKKKFKKLMRIIKTIKVDK